WRRLQFAREMLGAPEHFWEAVVFTDECKVNVRGPDGPRTTWRLPGPPYRPEHFQRVEHFGGGSVMVWGAITSQGVGALVVIPTTMTAEVFVGTLRVGLDATLRKYHLELDNVFLQMDNDPKHTSARARRYYREAGIRVPPWPSLSPDLNPTNACGPM
ncbi:hypothetical protein PAPHI01_2685, partial [Pancytospora philotis]